MVLERQEKMFLIKKIKLLKKLMVQIKQLKLTILERKKKMCLKKMIKLLKKWMVMIKL